MAGKSTYARQAALLTLLAQMGSYIPAQMAHLGIVDRIFTRVGAADLLARGMSTFMLEMTETAHILRHATSRSLIILDEVGRGTGTADGLAIARAVIEYLVRRVRAKTIFTTHYHEVTTLADTYEAIGNACLQVRDDGGDVTFLYKVLPGVSSHSYGIHVARLAGLPEEVVAQAEALLTESVLLPAHTAEMGIISFHEATHRHCTRLKHVCAASIPCTPHPLRRSNCSMSSVNWSSMAPHGPTPTSGAPMNIHILPPHLQQHIAAGEIIERPASVVKELLENALDAGAQHISVDVEHAGRQLICVTDDGAGIAPEDVPLAFERFATSKIDVARDIESVRTFGFRGEALPSIAAVSRVEVLTRPHGAVFGTCAYVEGALSAVDASGASVGTRVEVRDLFFNTPARRKFLRSLRVELSHIMGVFTTFAIAFPEYAWSLRCDGRSLFELAAGSFRDRLLALYGQDVMAELEHFDGEGLSGRVWGSFRHDRSAGRARIASS